MRRAQITIFIVLGFIIVATFFLLFYLAEQTAEQKASREIQKVIKRAMSVSAFRFFTEECLRSTLEDAILTIARRGGYLAPSKSIRYNNENISIILYPATPIPDYYPCSGAIGKPPDFCRFSLEQPAFAGLIDINAISAPSIENEIESYIEEEAKKCINISALRSITGYNLNISSIKPIVKLSGSKAKARLNFVLTAKLRGKIIPIVENTPWIEVKTRLYQILYPILKIGINADWTNVTADLLSIMQKEASTYVFPQGNITVSKTSLDGIDIFIINDSLYKIKNKPLLFQFARENRPPILSYISRYPDDQGDDAYDVLIIEGENLSIDDLNITYADPDEDNVTESFPRNVPSTIGYHNLTFTIFDKHDLNDSQLVRFLVDPKFILNASVTANYSDIPLNTISLEDPIIVNSQPKQKTLDKKAKYLFHWTIKNRSATVIALTLQNFSYQLSKAEAQSLFKACIPNKNCTAIIKAYLFYPSGFNQTDEKAFTVKVKQCLPHRSSFPSYPFSVSPLQGNHSCCLDDYTIAPNTTVCYSGPNTLPGQPFNSSNLHCYNIIRYCDGNTGNKCLGKIEIIGTSDTCCFGASACVGEKAYSLTSEGWCYGKGGCQKLCTTEVVDSNGDGFFNEKDHCNCGFGDKGKLCQKLIQGTWYQGTCSSGFFGIGAKCIT